MNSFSLVHVWKIVISVLWTILVAQIGLSQSSGIEITGRAVDSKGNPVPGAFVLRFPARTMQERDCENPDQILAIADKEGNWRFNLKSDVINGTYDIVVEPEAFLFERNFVPISRSCDSSRVELRRFLDGGCRINNSGAIDLGSVEVQRLQTAFEIAFEDSEIRTSARSSTVWLRIRNQNGDIVFQSGVPSLAWDETGERIQVLLPNGTWTLDFAFQANPWKSIGSEKVNAVYEQYRTRKVVIERIANDVHGAVFENAIGAKAFLLDRGIAFTKEEFLKSVQMGNSSAVKAFLLAGMDPNSSDESKRTALMFAVAFQDIVKELLTFGADPNLSTRNQITALYIAVTMANINVVELLIDAGANPFIKADKESVGVNGQDAQQLAEQRGLNKILEVLGRFKPVD